VSEVARYVELKEAFTERLRVWGQKTAGKKFSFEELPKCVE